MHTLEKAVNVLLKWRPDWQQDRQQAIKHLQAIIASCKQVVAVWQGYLKSPTVPEDKDTLVKWVGPERAKQLQLINLDVIQASQVLAMSAEPYYLGAAINLEPHIVEEAYRQMHKGETGTDAANTAINNMEQRLKWLQGLVDKLNKAGAPKKTTAKPGEKTMAKKKKPVKQTRKKAKKKAKKAVKKPKKAKKSVKKQASKKKRLRKR